MERLRRVKRREKSSKETLESVFEDLLKDIYWGEKHLAKALPKLAKASFNQDLRKKFEKHLAETKAHITRIEECFDFVEGKAVPQKCEAMKGLVLACVKVIDKYEHSNARDVALIAAAQKIEHYEISAYGTLQAIAAVLEKGVCARLFEETKEEEVTADINLTELSARINQLAAELVEEEVE